MNKPTPKRLIELIEANHKLLKETEDVYVLNQAERNIELYAREYKMRTGDWYRRTIK